MAPRGLTGTAGTIGGGPLAHHPDVSFLTPTSTPNGVDPR